MVKRLTKFVCQQCGYESTGWLGKCPNCGSWNSLVETIQKTEDRRQKTAKRPESVRPVKLGEVEKKKFERVSTGIDELDRVLGEGLVPGQVVLVAGEPGIGKSTLLLQAAEKVTVNSKSEQGQDKVLYVSGEESVEQIALRAERLGISSSLSTSLRKGKTTEIYLLSETDIDNVLGVLSDLDALSLIIIDSIQTMTTGDLAGVSGSVGQVRECAARIIRAAKDLQVPAFIVGHVTKEGTIAGPRVLEHLVDTVLWFEGSRSEALRIIRTVKNRFGPTDETGVFEMKENGLFSAQNPSLLFLAENKEGKISGSVVTCLIEGTRPILVEVQALVVPSQLTMPRRVASGVDFAKLQLLVAVLTRRLGLPLGTHDVFVNIAGGIRVEEPAVDLAIALAIISAYKDKPIDPKAVVFGEVGLLGEIRPVKFMEKRAKESERLGFSRVAGPLQAKTIGEAMKFLG